MPGKPANRLPSTGLPARGYRWAPFQPGHTATLKHGADSPRMVEPLAAAILEQVQPGTYLDSPDYRPALGAWARNEARCVLLAEWLAVNGLLDAEGKPRPALDAAIRVERLAAESRARLGLDPLARARLGKDITGQQVDLARLWAAERGEETEDTNDG